MSALIFKDNPFPRYIKHVATYICGLLVLYIYTRTCLCVYSAVWKLGRTVSKHIVHFKAKNN